MAVQTLANLKTIRDLLSSPQQVLLPDHFLLVFLYLKVSVLLNFSWRFFLAGEDVLVVEG